MKNKLPYIDDNEPVELRENSRALLSALSSETIDEERILSLVLEREQTVNTYLQREDVEKFARNEYKTNQELTEIISALRDQKKNEIVNFLRSRKAATKYTKRGR